MTGIRRPPMVVGHGPRLGAYGLCLRGLPAAEPWMRPQADDAPSIDITVSVGPADESPSHVDGDSADLRLLDGGRLQARRDETVVRYTLAAVPPDEDLLHPYVGPAAALVWRWAGREAIHAGVLALGGGAVLLLGDKGAGKSTTLAWLAKSAGIAVLADDLAVIDGTDVLAGPRTIDLREPLAGATSASRPVRQTSRNRVTLPTAPNRLPLAGVAVLAWGPTTAVDPVPMEQRWELLGAQRNFPKLPGSSVSMLELVTVPFYRVTRPFGLESLGEAGPAIVEAFR